MQKKIKKFLTNYFLILSNALFCMTIYCTVFEWSEGVDIKTLWQLLAVSFICTFTMVIYYSKKELSRQQMKIRIVIHFFVIVFILLLSAFLCGWVDFSDKLLVIAFAALVAITYWTVMFLINFLDEKLAKKMNQKLKELQNRQQ